MIIIKSTSILIGELIMPLSLSIAHHLKPQVSTAMPAAQTAQPTVPGHTVNSGAPAGGVDSTELLRGKKAVAIHHNGLTYRLQATRLGKLILTK